MARRKDNKGRVLKDGESYRKSDNRYMYRWTGKDGKRHTIYHPDLMALREQEEKILHDLRDGIKVGENNVTVNDVYELWKNDKIGLKQTTSSNYFYMYEHFVMDSFGKCKIKDIDKTDVRRLYNELVDKKKMTVATVDNVHTVLHQVLDVAVEKHLIRINPSDGAMGDCKKAHNYQKPKRHSLTIPQQEAFIKFLASSRQYKHWLPLFTFFLGTGCRVSEVVGLRWRDVNLEENYVSINHNLVYYAREKRKCEFMFTTPKTDAGKRFIPLLPEVKQALLDELEYQKECEITCQATYGGFTDYVFLNRFGNIHNPQTINRTIKRVSLAYNVAEIERADKEHREPILLPPFSCHNLRHTFATRYCENETNLKVIQEIMGHRDIVTTMDVYAEATKEAKVKSFEGLVGKIKIS